MRLSTLLTIAFLSSNTAFALPQRHLGLWRQTTEIKITFDPELTPEQRSFIMKPGSLLDGTKHVVETCVTQEMNDFAAQVQKRNSPQKFNKVCRTETHDSEFTTTTDMKCGKPGNETSIRTAWNGDTHFETNVHTKSVTEGRRVEGNTRTVGEFVRDDCGSVKPMRLPLQDFRRPTPEAKLPATPEAKQPLAAPGSDPLRPVMRTHVLPPYPPDAPELHDAVRTTMDVHITVGGTVDDCKVLRSSGHNRLDQAACDFVKSNWRWQPPTNQGQPFAVSTMVNIIWDVKNASETKR